MDFKNVTVAGSGVLGSQIAFQTAFKGFDVTIWLRSEGSIERAKPKLERLKGIYLQTMEAWKTNPQAYCRGFADSPDLSADEIDALKEKVVEAFDSLKMTTSYEEAAKDADLIIEAIAEDPAHTLEDLKNTLHCTLQTIYGRKTQLKSWDTLAQIRNTTTRLQNSQRQ